MKLLIISDNDSNELYSSIETDSIGYLPNIFLDKIDYDIISNNLSNINILAFITNEKGIGKLFFASLHKVEKSSKSFDLTYKILHVIEDKSEISNFNRAFPYAFKEENSAKLSNSEELIQIVKFFNPIDNSKKRITALDIKSVIMNTDAYRLQSSKTEVYKKSYEDGVHTRLSHSIRVSHISSLIAKRLEETLDLKLNYNLIDNISMGLNIGHTPYGNVGEKVIGEILNGSIDIIPNVDVLGLKYFKHNLQSARMLERVESITSRQNNFVDLDVIAGIIAHTRLNFDKDMYNNSEKVNKYLSKYYISYDKLIGKYAILKENQLIPRTLEAQIVIVADEIAQKSYDVELAIRSESVDKNKIITRLKLLSELTGEYLECDFNNRNDRYYASRQISSHIVKYLIESACDSVRFEKINKGNIESYINFSETGTNILEMLDNYFQSKLLLSRKVRLYDHKSRQIIKDIFTEVYNDINLLPSFHKNRIIEEFYKEGIKDINILLCFISFEDGIKYLDNILYSDIRKVRNKHEQELLIRKREIIIQAIIDYIVYLSDNDAKSLHEYLMFN